MPKKKDSSGRKGSKVDTALSARTKKQIDSLPEHAQHIFKKAHANAVKEYQNPAKRR
jgi:cation transport regulator